MKQVLLILFWLISSAVLAQEICNNGIDDDSDGLIDCEDGDCVSAGQCPTVFDQTPTLCEDTPGSGSAIVDLTSYEFSIKGNDPYTVSWYQDTSAAGIPVNPIATPNSYSATNTDIAFAEVDDGTNQNIASVTFTINSTPTASDQTPVVCEDTPDSGQASVDLTSLESSINSVGGHTFIWFEDASLTIPIAAPANYTVSDGQAVYASVDNGACNNVAEVTYTVNSPDAEFSYSYAGYCQGGTNPTPVFNTGSAGVFSSVPGLVIDSNTGEIDLASSTLGTYTVTNTINSGSCNDSHNVLVEILSEEDASFDYSGMNTFCQNEVNPMATITGEFGGVFSSTVGLVFVDINTGEIDLANSTAGTYDITYTTSGSCPASSDVSITINPAEDADFSYPGITYCPADANPTPTVNTPGGTFSSPTGLALNASTGEVDLASSPAGNHTINYTVNGTCPNSETFTIDILDDTEPAAQPAVDVTCDGFTASWDPVFGTSDYEVSVSEDYAFSSLVPGYDAVSITDTFLDVTGLSVATTYFYRVHAVTSCGTSVSSDTITVHVLDTLSTSVTNLIASNPSCSGFKVSWNPVTHATRYLLEVSQDGFATTDISQSLISTSITLTTLSTGTTYEFRVTPKNACGMGPSATGIYQTSDVPDTPANAFATNPACDGADFSWDVAPTATNYLIEVDDDPAFGSIDVLQTVATTTFTVTGLMTGTTYYGRVTARNSCGSSVSASLNFTTHSLPANPVNVQAAAEYNQVTMRWDTVLDATAYTVEVATDEYFSSPVSTVSVDSTQAIATGLVPLTTYYGIVTAGNSCGYGYSSDTIMFTTPQDSLILDSLALVELYNATNGPAWSDNMNWLSGPVENWQGVTVENHRVTQLDVSNNQLSGTFPTEMANLTSLVYADFQGNALTGTLGEWADNFRNPTDSLKLSGNQLTDIVGTLPHTQGVIELDNNQLTFGDLIPVLPSLPNLSYASQATIGSTSTTFRNTGDSYTLSLNIDASVADNQYIWFRDGAAIDTTTTNQYVMNPIVSGDDGVYTCQITNPNVPELMLTSYPMTVNVQAQANSLTFSPIADVAYGNEPFVLNAVATSGLPAYYEVIKGDSLVSLQGDVVTPLGVGEVTIRATQPGDDFYGAATPVTQQFTITRGSQTIAFTAINDQDIALTDSLLLNISASSGLPVELTVTGPAELEDSILVLLDTGMVTVTANQSGSLIYEPALSVSQSFQVYSSDTISSNPDNPEQTEDLFTVKLQLAGEAKFATVTASLHKAANGSFTREQEQLLIAGSGEFTNVSDGIYSLRFDPEDGAYFPTYSGNQLTLAQASTHTLLKDTTLIMSLLPKPDTSSQIGVSVSGTLLLESTAGGRILEERALSGVRVYLVHKTDQTVAGYGISDTKGAFNFPNIPPGSYYFLADYEGKSFQNNRIEVADMPLTLVAVAEQTITLRTVEEEFPAEPGTVTSIGEEVETAISAYPNPAVTEFTIVIPTGWIGSRLTIMDISGKQVAGESLVRGKSTLSLKPLPSGLYYLRLQNGERSHTMKLVKQ
uniref:Fibronectin type III domain-containing protein n=1 Tax=Roseihalotalea indica TaxID=2867963 RepID=A0AA49GUC9_9BACT|nr:fibronectin type III domain-containing protein [Tunicatimonas sp. TK19036]